MTIDTLFGKRFYLLIILELKSRRIIRFDLTENPCREFVKQRIVLLSEDFPDKKTLINDNAAQFTSIDYRWFDIKGGEYQSLCSEYECFCRKIERLDLPSTTDDRYPEILPGPMYNHELSRT